MKKTITVLTFGAVLFALSVSAHAQQSKKVYRIGYLANAAGIGPAQEAFGKLCAILGMSKIKT